MKEISCENCLHINICHLHESCNNIEEEVKEMGCEDFSPSLSEREKEIIEAYRHLGKSVYSAIFNVSGEEPRLREEKIHHIVLDGRDIDFYDEDDCFISSFSSIGHWNNDLFSSFSSSEVEEKIEEWWKKKLGLDY